MKFLIFPDELSEFAQLSSQQKVRIIFLGLSPSIPNFPDNFPNFFDYFLNSHLLSEFWFTFQILAKSGPGSLVPIKVPTLPAIGVVTN